MNLNFLLAGTVSTNPIMLVLALGIILARRVAGHWVSTATPAPHCVDKTTGPRAKIARALCFWFRTVSACRAAT